MPLRRLLTLVAFLLLFLYFGLYAHLSRRGAAWCRQYNCCGFYYALPHDGENWENWHYTCIRLFRPANDLDRALGGEFYPAACVGFGLAK
jgi:hypothetical protein